MSKISNDHIIEQLSAIPEIAEWFDPNNKHLSTMKILTSGISFINQLNGEMTYKEHQNTKDVVEKVIEILSIDGMQEHEETYLEDKTRVLTFNNGEEPTVIMFRRYYQSVGSDSHCGSFDCEKYRDCARADIGQKPGKVRGLVMWASYGSGSADSNGVRSTWYCGSRGDYGMFVPRFRPIASNKPE